MSVDYDLAMPLGVGFVGVFYLHLDLAEAEDIAVLEFRFFGLDAVYETASPSFQGLDVVPPVRVDDSCMEPGDSGIRQVNVYVGGTADGHFGTDQREPLTLPTSIKGNQIAEHVVV